MPSDQVSLTQRRSAPRADEDKAGSAEDSRSQSARSECVGIAEPVWSSGVPFYPPSTKFWRIGGKWYDFKDFLPKHPGGDTVLLLSRDRFEDCTFVFESHHINYHKVRAIIQKYEVSEEVVKSHGLNSRPTREQAKDACHHDSHLDTCGTVKLLDDSAFYSVLRRRVKKYLSDIKFPDGGPTFECKVLFWISFTAFCSSWFGMWYTGRILFGLLTGFTAAWLGAFGHNWVHQPKYKLWAYLSLDTIGFNSDAWFREHNLQHHMYTNTPWDNHFKGTDPFLVTDPTVPRNFLQRWVSPYISPFILCFGLQGNYIFHTVEMIKGHEKFTLWKCILVLQTILLVYRWGLWGAIVQFVSHATLGNYYFNIALMNHNSERCFNIKERNESSDFAVAQLCSSADWAVQSSFLSAGRYLWLNYHTVHHLFPLIDFSHHPGIQRILMDACKEYGVTYVAGKPFDIYKEMLHSFSTPAALMQEILVYGGGI